MSKRFKQLTSLDINYYEPNVPVEIDKGVILLDTATNQTLLQLKLRNISNQIIKFVELEVECFDLTGEPVGENHIVQFIYQDFEVFPKQFFGDRQAIQLAGEKTRQVNIIFKKVMFKDGTVEMFDKVERFEIPQTESIDTLPADLRKEIDSLHLSSQYAEITNFPKEISDHEWVCCCGRVNANNGNCVRCGRSKNYQFEKLTMDNLKQLAENTREAKRQLEEAERKKREEEEKQRQLMLEKKQQEKIERRKKQQEMTKKILKRVSRIVAILIVVIIVISGGMYILNEKKYQQAKDLYENEEYYNAYNLFSDMKYYRDSREMINQIQQNKFIFSEGYAPVKIDKMYGIINQDYELIQEVSFEEIDYFKEGLARVKLNGLYGFIDTDFNLVIDTIYEDANSFSNDKSKVKINGKYGIINTKGEYIIEPTMDEIEIFSTGLIKVKIDDKYGVTSLDGTIIFEPVADEITFYSMGRIVLKIDDKYMIASSDGTIIFEVVADEVTALSYGVFAVKVDGVWGFMNKAGSWLIQPMFKEVDFTNSQFPLVKIEDINAVKDIFYEDTYSERNLPQKWYELWITNDGVFYSYQGKIELSQHSHSIKY